MKILVTGANGLLGQKLIGLLEHEASISFIATARNTLKYTLSRGTFAQMDVTNQDQVAQVMDDTQPDVVIHAAAMTQVDQCETERQECWKQNVTGVENITRACEKQKAHLVHISTDFIFDGSEGPLREDAIPQPVNFYGESKLAGELVVQNSSASWCILRTILVYGVTPGIRSNIVLWVKKSLEEGKQINVVDDQWRTPTLAEDLATACWLAAQKKSTGVYHISSEEMMTPYELAMRTASFFKLDTQLIRKTDSATLKQPARRPPKTGFIVDKAKRDFGFQPHTFEEGLGIVSAQIAKFS